MSSETPLRILISGGGIAGPTVAFWLSQLGHSCTLIERFPNLRAQGQQIDIRAQGVEVLRRMGILGQVKKCLVAEEGSQFVNVDGKTQAYFSRGSGTQGAGVTTEYEIMRGDLCRIIFDAIKDSGVTIKFGVTVDTFDHDTNGVVVSLSDGTRDTYDLLIGADGQASRIRKKLLADNGMPDALHSFGVLGSFFTIARRPEDDRNIATVCMSPNRRVMMTRWHSKTKGQAYLFSMSHTELLREAFKQDAEQQKKALKAVFGDAGWQASRILKTLDTTDDFYSQEVLQVRSTCWHKHRVVLLGDAGYAPSPFSGRGTTLALVGAYVLAGELARSPRDVEGAIEAYDATMRPFVKQSQKLTRGLPGIIYRKTALQIWLLNFFFWFLSVAMPLIELFNSMFPRETEKWEMPDYAQLQHQTEGKIGDQDRAGSV